MTDTKSLVLGAVIGWLPQNKISTLAGKFTHSSLSKYMIPLFIKTFKIDTVTAEKPVEEYSSLNEFFTRRLKNGARPIDQDKMSIVSPVDGVIAQTGKIKNGTLVQAKGINYTVEQLLGNDEKAKKYENGSFIAVYLSPQDYHRIHMPFTGEIINYEYIPGRLFPVNNIGVKQVDGLFTKNERLTSYIDSVNGEAALVKVGAFIVGSIQVAYQENIHQLHRGEKYQSEPLELATYGKGEDIALFEFGSTIILLLEETLGELDEGIEIGCKLKMGERIGTLKDSSQNTK